MTRDDFPYSLQPYATPAGGNAAADVEEWSLVLFRAADETERAWFRENGFVLQGRVWVRTAPLSPEPSPPDAPEPPPKGSTGPSEIDEGATDSEGDEAAGKDDAGPDADADEKPTSHAAA